MIGPQEMHLDRGHLVHAQRSHRIEIRLFHTASIDGYGLPERAMPKPAHGLRNADGSERAMPRMLEETMPILDPRPNPVAG
jgi:hypothetical protein